MRPSSQRQDLTAIIKNKRGSILSIGKNSYVKTHPIMSRLASKIGIVDSPKIYIHAEMDAIIKCKDLTKAYSIEIYRVSRETGLYVNSTPCRICQAGILNTPIRYMKYVDKDNLLVTMQLY